MRRFLFLLCSSLLAWPQAANYYVSHSGSDSNTGLSVSAAFRTVDKARQAVRGLCLSATGAIAVNLIPDSPYYQGSDLGSSLTFTGNTSSYPSSAGEGDNGCSAAKPVIYQTAPGYSSKAVISGGMRISGWTPTGYTFLQGGQLITQYSAPCKSPCTDTEILFYNGDRRIRPQIGTSIVDGTVTVSGAVVTWTGGTAFSTQWVNSKIRIPANGPEYQVLLVTDTTHLTLYTSPTAQGAQSYNSYVLSNLAVMNALEYNNDPSTICPLGAGGCSVVQTTDACGLTGYGCSAGTNANCRHTNSSVATYCDDRIRYASAGATNTANLSALVPVNLSGSTDCSGGISGANFDTIFTYFETFATPTMRICGIDTTNRILIFTGEFLDANVSSGQYGPIDKARFTIENYPDPGGHKITQAQQWYLDRTVSPPVFYYNAVPGENPNTDTVEVGVNTFAAVIHNARWLTFRNIQFKHDNWLIPDAGIVSPTGKPEIQAAVSVQNSTNINFELSDITETSAGGLEMINCRSGATDASWCLAYEAGGTTHDSYFHQGSIYDIGANGIRMGTRLDKSDHTTDSDTNVPYNISITDSLLAGISRRIPQAVPFTGGVLHDVKLTHLDVYDSYHSGLALCGANCDFGTGHGIFNYEAMWNHLRFLSQGVTPDDGGLYMGNATGNNLASGSGGANNKLWYNLVHDVNDPDARPDNSTTGYGSSCEYTDNMANGISIRYNVVYRCGEVGFRMTGIPAFFSGTNANGQVGIGATAPNEIVNNIGAYMRTGAVQTGTGNSFWGTTGDPIQRKMVKVNNNVFYSDRDHASQGSSSGNEFYMQRGCAESGGFTFTSVYDFSANQYYNTLHTDGTAYAKYMHVTKSTASPITGCATDKTGWAFATSTCWTGGGACYTNNAGSGTVPVVQSAGEDAGSSFSTNPGFVSPGYPNDDYHLTCPLAITGFDCAQTNATLDKAGRLTNKSFNPWVVQTFSTAYWDPGHTNNGRF